MTKIRTNFQKFKLLKRQKKAFLFKIKTVIIIINFVLLNSIVIVKNLVSLNLLKKINKLFKKNYKVK